MTPDLLQELREFTRANPGSQVALVARALLPFRALLAAQGEVSARIRQLTYTLY